MSRTTEDLLARLEMGRHLLTEQIGPFDVVTAAHFSPNASLRHPRVTIKAADGSYYEVAYAEPHEPQALEGVAIRCLITV